MTGMEGKKKGSKIVKKERRLLNLHLRGSLTASISIVTHVVSQKTCNREYQKRERKKKNLKENNAQMKHGC